MKKRLAMVVTILLLMLVLDTTAEAQEAHQELYMAYCEIIGERYNIQPEYIEAICFKESSWRANAKNGECIGLMQVNPHCHADRMKKLGVTDLTDAYDNILVGTDYIAELAVEYGEPLEVLMIFNMGDRGRELYEQGIVSQYAEDVSALSIELEMEHYGL